MPLARRFEDLTSAELGQRRETLGRAVAVLPVAAVEQHGEHLPLGTDALIADAMVAGTMARLPDALEAVFLPVLRVGASDEHLDFPGTLSLGWRIAADTIVRLGEGVAAAGFARMAVVSSHGGNTPAVEAAALELRRRLGLLCASASWNRFGLPPGLLPEAEVATGIHGGALETALMLHIRPDLVRRDRVADRPSLQTRLAAERRHLRAHGRLGFGWLAQDLNPVGTVGDARLGTAEIGRAILEHQAARFAEFLADVAAVDWPPGPVQS
ncbi:creatininase family protein [Aureimonas flava]|uniref:Creatininase family protein n=1 Tax=Aureimonas flava TaxID=2320271 RepID=A0A3A1WPB0_9HYPH|nr:creatininase family protein [Aureimonas flava]RIY01966.1 creatininase family protein [Aureimonas flava]